MTTTGDQFEAEGTHAASDGQGIVATRLPLFEAGNAHRVVVPIAISHAIVLSPMIMREGWVAFLATAGVFAVIAAVLRLMSWSAFKSLLEKRPTPPKPRFLTQPTETPSLAVIKITADERLREVVLEAEGRHHFLTFNGRSRWDWQRFLERLHGLSIMRPHAIVDEEALSQLSRIALPAHLLEPEPILSSGDRTRLRLILGCAGMTIFGITLCLIGWWPYGACCIAGGLIGAAQLPPVRDLFRDVPMQESQFIAGPGVLLDQQRKRRWTIDDAVMLVQCTPTLGPLIVRVVGEAGSLTLPFSDEQDPDFIRLWQRWNHPQPRPELLPGERHSIDHNVDGRRSGTRRL